MTPLETMIAEWRNGSGRELLEKAAKAAGIEGCFMEETPLDGHPSYECGIGTASWVSGLWNSLTKNSDALRLAVKLPNAIDLTQIVRLAWKEHPNDEAARMAFVRRRITECAAAALAESEGDRE